MRLDGLSRRGSRGKSIGKGRVVIPELENPARNASSPRFIGSHAFADQKDQHRSADCPDLKKVQVPRRVFLIGRREFSVIRAMTMEQPMDGMGVQEPAMVVLVSRSVFM